jgi:hypothetical protein
MGLAIKLHDGHGKVHGTSVAPATAVPFLRIHRGGVLRVHAPSARWSPTFHQISRNVSQGNAQPSPPRQLTSTPITHTSVFQSASHRQRGSNLLIASRLARPPSRQPPGNGGLVTVCKCHSLRPIHHACPSQKTPFLLQGVLQPATPATPAMPAISRAAGCATCHSLALREMPVILALTSF